MNLVVVARPPASLDAAIAALVRLQQLSLYEARARLTGDPPRVVAILGSDDEARALNASLLAAGFVSLIVTREHLRTEQRAELIASLSFEPHALVAELRDGRTREVPWGDLRLLLRGLRATSRTTTHEETKSTFSPVKSILTGGMINSTKKTTTTTVTTTDRQGFFSLYDRSGDPPLVLVEQRTNYRFLGAAIQPSSLANFLAVVKMVRERAPHARHDERLLRPANLGVLPLPPPGVDPDSWKVDVASAVLAAAADAIG